MRPWIKKSTSMFIFILTLGGTLLAASCQSIFQFSGKTPATVAAPPKKKKKECVPITFAASPDSKVMDPLCPTLGEFKVIPNWGKHKSTMLETNSPQTRGIISQPSSKSIGLCFSYMGMGAEKSFKVLGSGMLRQQIGLKLRAQDSCNLIYIMWRLVPDHRIVINRKLNAGKSTHKECKNDGYKTIKAIKMHGAPIKQGEFHSLRVNFDKNQLQVFADEKMIWEGTLEKDLEKLVGPMGFRSDNGQFLFQIDDMAQITKLCPIP